jgi:hypothetical protein
MAREVNRLLARIFSERRKAARLDWEAIEMAVRSALHQAGPMPRYAFRLMAPAQA